MVLKRYIVEMDSPKYLFANLTQDKRSKDRKTAKEIRTYVMQDIGKARRKTRKNARVPLELRSSLPPLLQSRLDITSMTKPSNSTRRDLRGEYLEVESHTSERSVAESVYLVLSGIKTHSKSLTTAGAWTGLLCIL